MNHQVIIQILYGLNFIRVVENQGKLAKLGDIINDEFKTGQCLITEQLSDDFAVKIVEPTHSIFPDHRVII